jgi:transposase
MIPTYPLLIQENVAQLQVAEKAARDKARADRLRLLRFLKEGRVASVSQAAEVLGYSVRTAQRWWQSYREGGLAALLAPPSQRGLKERITPEAWDGLQAEMPHRREAQLYLRDTWRIEYGIDALSKLFRRRKLKTGRPHHRNSPAEQAAFKK